MRAAWRVAGGLALLALALILAFAFRGVGEARASFGQLQAEWQRGLRPTAAAPPGRAQRLGEALLGVRARSDLLRAYRDFEAGIGNVIPGTVYPQTSARFDAITRFRDLRAALTSDRDRASADIVLGAIFAAGISTPGEQHAVQTSDAIDSFTRAVLEDPTNATAKLDLEIELRSELDKQKASSQARATGSPSRRRQRQQDPRGPSIQTQTQGEGY
jgi:hypothetical protein